MFNLLSELSDNLSIWVLIDSSNIDNGSSLLGISQCTERLCMVYVRRADSGNHGGLGVTTQTLFKQPGQCGVSVRNENFLPATN